MKVLVNSTPVALWRDVIHEAESICKILLREEIEAYLVFLLLRYTNKPQSLVEIMAGQFLEAAKLQAKERELAMQRVGDLCLLFTGLFPGMSEKRLVKISYFINIGRTAYSTISKVENDLYGLLNQEFVAIMDVLQATRLYGSDCPDLLPLQAYELWNESGSRRALDILKSYTNAMPVSTRVGDEPDARLFKLR